MAFYGLEPWGAGADDYRAGTVAATVANVNRDPKQDAFHPEDFIPQREPREAPGQSAEEQQRTMEAWVQAMGGRAT